MLAVFSHHIRVLSEREVDYFLYVQRIRVIELRIYNIKGILITLPRIVPARLLEITVKHA